MDLNFFAALEMMQAFGPMLVEAKGTVVNNSSVGGYIGFPFTSEFSSCYQSVVKWWIGKCEGWDKRELMADWYRHLQRN